MSLNLDFSKTNKYFLLVVCLLSSASMLAQEKGQQLYEENLEASKFISSFQMDCRQATPRCRERSSALRAEETFNQYMEVIFERQVDAWPNNEFALVEDAFFIRQDADYSFEGEFFGDAKIGYDRASEILDEILESADKQVEDLLAEGERYLYREDKPDWAESYFREALPYDPENERIKRGIARIEFLLNFESNKIFIEDLISKGQFTEATDLIENLLLGDPGNEELENYLFEISIRDEESIIVSSLNSILEEKDRVMDDLDLQDAPIQLQKALIDINNRLLSDTEDLVEIYSVLFELTGDEFYISDDAVAFYRDEIESTNAKIDELMGLMIAASITEFEIRLSTSDAENNLKLLSDISDFKSKNTLEEVDETRLENLVQLAIEKQNNFFNEALLAAEASEDWKKALSILDDINMFNPTQESREKTDAINIIVNGISIIDNYNSSPSLLYSRRELNQAKKLVDSLESTSGSFPNANNLVSLITNFKQSISDAEVLVAESEREEAEKQRIAAAKREEERKRAEEERLAAAAERERSNNRSNSSSSGAESNSRQPQTSSQSQPSQSSSSSTRIDGSSSSGNNSSSSLSAKAKLDYSSFGEVVYCPRTYRNKSFRPTWKIEVTSDGKAKSVEVMTIKDEAGNDVSMNGNDNKILEIVNKGLLDSDFKPAKMGSVSVESVLTLSIKIPERFCG